ncbi:hypothetical protein BD309DRAFT_1056424 [Dichomitus squalens]|nr:hypothetical protein BD309DRAFT_1056424 [Dichomitus squalens]
MTSWSRDQPAADDNNDQAACAGFNNKIYLAAPIYIYASTDKLNFAGLKIADEYNHDNQQTPAPGPTSRRPQTPSSFSGHVDRLEGCGSPSGPLAVHTLNVNNPTGAIHIYNIAGSGGGNVDPTTLLPHRPGPPAGNALPPQPSDSTPHKWAVPKQPTSLQPSPSCARSTTEGRAIRDEIIRNTLTEVRAGSQSGSPGRPMAVSETGCSPGRHGDGTELGPASALPSGILGDNKRIAPTNLAHIGKWYVVTVGRKVGVFAEWVDVAPHVNGVNRAVYKKFPSRVEAVDVYEEAKGNGEVRVMFHSAGRGRQDAVQNWAIIDCSGPQRGRNGLSQALKLCYTPKSSSVSLKDCRVDSGADDGAQSAWELANTTIH